MDSRAPRSYLHATGRSVGSNPSQLILLSGRPAGSLGTCWNPPHLTPMGGPFVNPLVFRRILAKSNLESDFELQGQ